MKISNVSVGPTVSKPSASGTSKSGAAGSSKATSSSVKVSVSQKAQALATATAASTIDGAKVERLRGDIERGDFHIDPRAIADAMLRVEAE